MNGKVSVLSGLPDRREQKQHMADRMWRKKKNQNNEWLFLMNHTEGTLTSGLVKLIKSNRAAQL